VEKFIKLSLNMETVGKYIGLNSKKSREDIYKISPMDGNCGKIYKIILRAEHCGKMVRSGGQGRKGGGINCQE
jgi:ssDNA-binding replication factor A large subunit